MKTGTGRWACIVCGRVYTHWSRVGSVSRFHSHRCNPRVIAAIEAANTRAEEPVLVADPLRRSIGERISEGVRMMEEVR